MNTKTYKQIIWFMGIAFAFTWGWVLIIELVNGAESLPPAGMFGPMIAALIVQKFIARRPIWGKNGLGFVVGKKRYWLIGPTIMFVVLAAIFGITYVAAPELFVELKHLPASLADASLPLSDSVPTALLTLFGLNVVLGPIINLPLMLGEEVGWRGFLTPNLVQKFGKRGLIYANVVWALWHVPMFFQGLNYSNNPWLGIPFMIGVSVPMGIIFQTMFQRSKGAIWVPALMHGVVNQTTMTVMNFLVRDEAAFNTFLHGPTGTIGIVVMGLLAIYFFVGMRLGWGMWWRWKRPFPLP